MTGDCDDWESIKENAAPLSRGRNVESLISALNPLLLTDEQQVEKLETKRKKFEKLLKLEEHDLVVWTSYIKFLQENFPSDTQSVFLVMERCVRALVDVEEYRNDARFLRICIRYADQTSAPYDVFKFLSQRKVGTKTALFWIAWAWEAEKLKDYAFAERIYQKGFQKQAEPRKLLDQRFKHFQRRMTRHWLKSSEAAAGNSNDDSDQYQERGGRGTLSNLTAQGVARNQRSRSSNTYREVDENGVPMRSSRNHSMSRITRRTDISSSSRAGRQSGNRISQTSLFATSGSRAGAHTSSSSNKANTSTGGFNIYVEEAPMSEENNDLNLSVCDTIVPSRKLETEAERRKENEQKAERWNARGGLFGDQGSPERPIRTQSSFAIFVDEDCSEENRDKLPPKPETSETSRPFKLTQRQPLDGAVVDKLAEDPLHYLREREISNKSRKDDKKQPQSKSRRHCGAKVALSEESNNLGFEMTLVCDENGEDVICFEENRGRNPKFYSILDPTVNTNSFVNGKILYNRKSSVAEMSIDEETETNYSVSMDGNTNVVDVGKSFESTKSVPKRVLFAPLGSSKKSLNVSLASSGVNSSIAVGGHVSFEDETINKKLAMRELSMMFTSPGNINQDEEEDNDELEKPFFSIYADNEDDACAQKNTNEETDHNTVTFSVFADIVSNEDVSSASKLSSSKLKGISRCDKEKSYASTGGGFDIFCDDENAISNTKTISTVGDSKKKGLNIRDETVELAFGDISHIEHSEERTLDFVMKNDTVMIEKECNTPTISDILGPAVETQRGIPYDGLWNDFVSHTLENIEGPVVRRVEDTLPQVGNRIIHRDGFKMETGFNKVHIKSLLGEGTFGKVFYGIDTNELPVALKIQSPLRCLPWEFAIISELQNRLLNENISVSKNLFPKVSNLSIFQDGALFQMSPASSHGSTILDLVNHYTQHGESVPELVAMHYTSIMLLALENLHLYGNILHCDVKPDNWVLTSVQVEDSEESDLNDSLMLVDFGKAIDLSSINESAPLSVTLSGSTNIEGMTCMAIQEGRPWSLDIDTYGLCETAHVLLFGDYVEVKKEPSSNRWKLAKPFRRYWNKELWLDLFDSLLNSTAGETRSSGSHPNNLKRLRLAFHTYLSDEGRSKELSSLLKRQQKFM